MPLLKLAEFVKAGVDVSFLSKRTLHIKVVTIH